MNKEIQMWEGEFGDKYIQRNTELSNFEYTDGNRKAIVESFFADIPRDVTILEIGCNSGNTIQILHDMGFTNITGIDINKNAIEVISKKFPEYQFIHSTIELYQMRKTYDLVFTSGVLVHIRDVMPIIAKIRCLSTKWIFGLEYYNEKFKETPYHDTVFWNAPYHDYFGRKPKRLEIHQMKDKSYRHVYYML